MLIINFIISLFAPIIIGVSFVLWFFPKKMNTGFFLLSLFLGILSGLILCSLFFFLFILVFNRSSTPLYQIIEMLIGSVFLFVTIKKKHFSFSFSFLKTSIYQKLAIFLLLYFCVQFFLNLIFLALYQPYGGGDAFSIWNLKARFMCGENGSFWKNMFSEFVFWSHPDYPLFLPSSICRIWQYLGVSSVFVPMFISVFVPLLTVLVLSVGVYIFSGFKKSFICCLVLVSTPSFLTWGTSQYADVPLSLFILSSVICFLVGQKDKNTSRGFLSLGIFFAASCVWIKSEGLFFFLIYVFAVFIFLRPNFKRFFGLARISFLILFPYVVFRIIAQFNDKFLKQSFFDIFNKLFSVDRHLIVIRAFGLSAFFIGDWFINPWVVIFLGFIVFGFCNFFKRDKKVLFSFFVLIAMIIIYYFFYIITPRGLRWHIDTSLSRLLIQLWPLGILNMVLLLNIKENNE